MFKNLQKNKDTIVAQLGQVSLKHIWYIFLFLIFTYAIIWTVIAKKISWTIIGEIDAMRDKKIDIAVGDYDNIGFPTSFSTVLQNVVYRNNKRSFVWKTNEIHIKAPLSNTNKIMIDFPTEQLFLRPDLMLNGKKNIHKIGVTSQICKAELMYNHKKLQNIHLKSSNGSVRLSDSQEIYGYDNFDFNMKESNVMIDKVIENILEMTIDIQRIQPSQFWRTVLEYDFSSLQATLYMRNPSNFARISDFYKFIIRNYDPPEIIIDNLVLKHPLSKMSLKGLVTFDADMRLNGTLVLTISDYQKILQFLTKKGVLSQKVANNFRFMLGFLMATKTLEKNDGTVDVDLTIKNNVVYQGNVRLFDMNN